MIGWVIILFIPALISGLLVAAYNNKRKAQKMCKRFEKLVSDNDLQFRTCVNRILEEKRYECNDGIIASGALIHLFSKINSGIKTTAINTQKTQDFSGNKYQWLMTKLQPNQVIYSYSTSSFTLYYRYPSPSESNVLRIWFPQDIR
jgi:hypothetical protein